MRSKRRHEGYLLIENRHAPGPTPEQIAMSGRTVLGAGQTVFETAVGTCPHCHRQIDLRGDRARIGYCMKCDHYTCDNPACANCTPLTFVLDLAQERAFKALKG